MLLGLTGCFGCGKSTVLKIFERLGARTISSDAIVHEALKDGKIKEQIANIFGPDVIAKGEVNRKRVAEQVFSDNSKRRRLERLLHPIVINSIKGSYREIVSHQKPETRTGMILIAEIPLLYEAGYEREVDAVIAVVAEENVVSDRLLKRGFTIEEIRRRATAQLSPDEKASRADYLIDNSGSLAETERQVVKVWKALLKR